MKFTKVYQCKKYGQIVAMRRQDKDGGPEIRVYFLPDSMGVCEFGFGFKNDDDGDAETRLDQAFDTLTYRSALDLVDGYYSHMTRGAH